MPDSAAHAEAHPGPRRRRRVWVLVVLLGLAVIGIVAWRESRVRAAAAAQAKNAAVRSISVAAQPATTGDMNVYLTSIGTVTPINTVTVHTRVDGQLDAVNYREGQLVRAGDTLAQIDPRPFQAVVANAEGQLAKDEATLANAKVDLQRYQTLFAQDSVAKQQVDTQAATVKQDEATLDSDRAQVDAANLNVTFTKILAPLTGRAGLRLVDPGNIVHATDPNGLVVITQVKPIFVAFGIAEDDAPSVLPKLRGGDAMAVDAFPRDPNAKKALASGSLATADNEIDLATATVKLKARFPNDDEALFPNQFVNIRLLIDTLHKVVLIPFAAVQSGPDGQFVFVVKPDSTVEMRTVKIQHTEGDQSAIASGVAAGEMVVTDGLDKLQAGVRVSVRNPSPPPKRGP